ncbi:DUF6957 family protein [Pseudomonas sp. PSB11]|uniref:DUF6957 family protein n=1 Tax=Pseudomonas sp. PSB11 TaxID=2021969 RepID=UPI0016610F70|nr:hypothetical protein [Pseudomonas sp. PSB11]MBD0678043.1 hypothetical protein [Pseudomonas sp. PSB11]
MVTLDEIAQLLYGIDGETSGWTGSQEDLISLAGKLFPSKAFCLVRQWILIDLTVTPVEKEKLTGLGLLPMTLFAHELVLDSKGRFQPKMWVRSNFGVSLIYGCMFETKNTVYLLWGPGQRKEATLEVAFSMSPA